MVIIIFYCCYIVFVIIVAIFIVIISIVLVAVCYHIFCLICMKSTMIIHFFTSSTATTAQSSPLLHPPYGRALLPLGACLRRSIRVALWLLRSLGLCPAAALIIIPLPTPTPSPTTPHSLPCSSPTPSPRRAHALPPELFSSRRPRSLCPPTRFIGRPWVLLVWPFSSDSLVSPVRYMLSFGVFHSFLFGVFFMFAFSVFPSLLFVLFFLFCFSSLFPRFHGPHCSCFFFSLSLLTPHFLILIGSFPFPPLSLSMFTLFFFFSFSPCSVLFLLSSLILLGFQYYYDFNADGGTVITCVIYQYRGGREFL